MTESDLVKLAGKGDKEAFCCLYARYKNRLYRYAYYRLGNTEDAQDAVSDCIVRAYEQISEVRRPAAFPAWIFKILYATCSGYVKQQMQQREYEDTAVSKNSTPLYFTIDENKTELCYALDRLSSEEKNIVLLSVVAGFTSKEISKITGLNAGSVRSKLSRSLAKMREYLE